MNLFNINTPVTNFYTISIILYERHTCVVPHYKYYYIIHNINITLIFYSTIIAF